MKRLSSSPDAYMGYEWHVVSDWRVAVSSILGFSCVPLFTAFRRTSA